MQNIIKNYAHDYRDMKMSEGELETMLSGLYVEFLRYQGDVAVDKLQEVVQCYFKNVLNLPCPDFRDNILTNPN